MKVVMIDNESFTENVKCLDEGSYSTRLPWKSDHYHLPANKNLALARLHSTTRKLEKVEEYHEIMTEQVKEGIIGGNSKRTDWRNHPLCSHQTVIREEAESTHLRIVYNCSACTSR